jgi:hypothetical protein
MARGPNDKPKRRPLTDLLAKVTLRQPKAPVGPPKPEEAPDE